MSNSDGKKRTARFWEYDPKQGFRHARTSNVEFEKKASRNNNTPNVGISLLEEKSNTVNNINGNSCYRKYQRRVPPPGSLSASLPPVSYSPIIYGHGTRYGERNSNIAHTKPKHFNSLNDSSGGGGLTTPATSSLSESANTSVHCNTNTKDAPQQLKLQQCTNQTLNERRNNKRLLEQKLKDQISKRESSSSNQLQQSNDVSTNDYNNKYQNERTTGVESNSELNQHQKLQTLHHQLLNQTPIHCQSNVASTQNFIVSTNQHISAPVSPIVNRDTNSPAPPVASIEFKEKSWDDDNNSIQSPLISPIAQMKQLRDAEMKMRVRLSGLTAPLVVGKANDYNAIHKTIIPGRLVNSENNINDNNKTIKTRKKKVKESSSDNNQKRLLEEKECEIKRMESRLAELKLIREIQQLEDELKKAGINPVLPSRIVDIDTDAHRSGSERNHRTLFSNQQAQSSTSKSLRTNRTSTPLILEEKQTEYFSPIKEKPPPSWKLTSTTPLNNSIHIENSTTTDIKSNCFKNDNPKKQSVLELAQQFNSQQQQQQQHRKPIDVHPKTPTRPLPKLRVGSNWAGSNPHIQEQQQIKGETTTKKYQSTIQQQQVISTPPKSPSRFQRVVNSWTGSPTKRNSTLKRNVISSSPPRKMSPSATPGTTKKSTLSKDFKQRQTSLLSTMKNSAGTNPHCSTQT
jgi:hypothetical protein